MKDPKERFSTRVENYIRYRPHYPSGVLDTLTSECGLLASSVIADIGSGTGILAGLFLRNGNTVYAVEPNREMRVAGRRLLKQHSNYRSVEGTAEATTLADASIDFVVAGQAFHWFDRRKSREEFSRILDSNGWVVLVWNDRLTGGTEFLEEYEKLVKSFAAEYAEIHNRKTDIPVLRDFFAPGGFHLKLFENHQTLDFDGLRGRLLSSSYTPEPGDPGFDRMIEKLEGLFRTHQRGGHVVMEYATRMCYGHLGVADGR